MLHSARPIPSSRDPVCGMDIVLAESQRSTTYRGLVLHFCSDQCQERFVANPDLYVGVPLRTNVPPLPKRRRLRIVRGDATAIAAACEAVRGMMGVTALACSDGRVEVEYDLRQATLAQIEAVATAAGVSFAAGLHGLRRALWRLMEYNELDNLAHPGTGACCNHPPARGR